MVKKVLMMLGELVVASFVLALYLFVQAGKWLFGTRYDPMLLAPRNGDCPITFSDAPVRARLRRAQ